MQINLDRAKKEKLFYVVATVVIYRDDGRCLILKRSDDEVAHPSKWSVPGGKLEWEDLKDGVVNGNVVDFHHVIEDLLKREALEEANVVVSDQMKYISSLALLRPDGVPVTVVKFAAKYVSGEAAFEKGAFTDIAWVNAQEIDAYDCIDGVAEEVKKAIELFLSNLFK